MRILVVDDKEEIRHYLISVLRQLIEREGREKSTEFHEAGNPVEALVLLNTHHFDIVFSDLEMGEEFPNGIELAESSWKQFRENRPFFVLITGKKFEEEDLKELQEHYVDRYLLKPADRRDFLAVIQAWREQSS